MALRNSRNTRRQLERLIDNPEEYKKFLKNEIQRVRVAARRQKKKLTRTEGDVKKRKDYDRIRAQKYRAKKDSLNAKTHRIADKIRGLAAILKEIKSGQEPPAETPDLGVQIKSESVSSEDSYHSDVTDPIELHNLQPKIEISEDMQFVNQPEEVHSTETLSLPGPSGEKRPAEDETITSPSKCLKVSDIDSTLRKLEELCDKAMKIGPEREDRYDSFGKYVASLLRGLPLHVACQLEGQIVKLILGSQMNSSS